MKKLISLLLLICAVANVYAHNLPAPADDKKQTKKEQTVKSSKAANTPKVKAEKPKTEPKTKEVKAPKAPKAAKPKVEKAPKATPAPKAAKPKVEKAPKATPAPKAAKPKVEKAPKATPAPKAAKPMVEKAPKATPAPKAAKPKVEKAPKATPAPKAAKPKVEKAPKATPAPKAAKPKVEKAPKATPTPKVAKPKVEKAPKATPTPKAAKPKAEKAPKAPKIKADKAVKAPKAQTPKADKAVKSSKAVEAEAPKAPKTAKVKSERKPRVDREINKNKFVFKGESMVGLTVSYGTVESEDSNIGLLIDDINLRGQMFTIKPHYGFFYRDNNAIGVRLGYSYFNGGLGNAGLNLGEANDIALALGNLAYSKRGFSAAIYHRSYMALDKKGRFGLFAEWELSGEMARANFNTDSTNAAASTLSDNYRLKLSFAPGLAVYIFPNVCASVSFGLGGLQYNHIKQMDSNRNPIGKRDFSKLRFGLDLSQINIGVTVHLWNKKKDK